MNAEQLHRTAEQVVSRIVLASDESTGSQENNLRKIGVQANPAVNRDYRSGLYETPKLSENVSGIILFDETIRQKANDGTPFPQFLLSRNILTGIKVDKGAKLLPGLGPDTYTEGIDGLRDRLIEYREMGAQFAKWRGVITISGENGGHPSKAAIEGNAHALAMYAALCQEAGLVPIVEPEVLRTGKHTLKDCERVTRRVLAEVFGRLEDYGVLFKGLVLKPNMVTPGSDAAVQASEEEVAKSTLSVIKDTVRRDVTGIAFLSGGLSPELATRYLNRINIMNNEDPNGFPGRITGSYGRALQSEYQNTWLGKPENVPAAQTVFSARVDKVHRASKGEL